METGPQLKVSFDRLVKPGIEPMTPGLQGKSSLSTTPQRLLRCDLGWSDVIYVLLQGLKAMDSNGLSDPYVKLHLLPGASKVYNFS